MAGIRKRDETRCSVNIKTFIEYLFIDHTELIILPDSLPINIINLSVGGILFHSKELLSKKNLLTLEFPIHNTKIYTVSEILRIENHEYSYYYGCRFLDISESDKMLIRKFVFEQQSKTQRRFQEESS